MICDHGKSGCNYPEGECIGNCGFKPLEVKEYKYMDAPIKNEIDWRQISMILADNVSKLSDMVMALMPSNDQVQESLKEVNELCAYVISTATVEKAKK